MKKATSANIGGRIFHLEEDGFDRLSAYLEAIRRHFADDEGGEEIIGDIEARIADRFVEIEPGHRPGAIPLEVVEEIVDSIGWPEELHDGVAAVAAAGTEQRKLFRDPQAGFIGGVCEGLGAYFDVRPLWIRLILVLGVLLMGLSIALYFLLWLLIPAARTAADRLAMRGQPVTLSSVADMAGRSDPVPTPRGGIARFFSRLFRLPRRVMDAAMYRTRAMIEGGSPVLRRVVGTGLILTGGWIVLLTLLAVGIGFTGFPSGYLDETYTRIMGAIFSGPLLIPVAIAVLIPAVLVALGGLSMLRNRSVLPAPIAFGMIGVWFLATVAAGVQASYAVMDWAAFEASSPLFEETSYSIEPGDIAELRAEPNYLLNMRIEQGETPSITFNGRRKDLDNVSYTRDGDVVTIERRDDPCVMCDVDEVSVMITLPDPASVVLPDRLVSMWESQQERAQDRLEREAREREMEQIEAARELAQAQREAEEVRIEALERQLEVQRLEAQVLADSNEN